MNLTDLLADNERLRAENERLRAEIQQLQRETLALEAERNAARATVSWRFTCQEARTRMQRLYPSHSA